MGWIMRCTFLLIAILLASPVRAEIHGESSFVRHLRYLASDELRGRGNDQPELLEAASYIAGEFEQLGLLPAGVDGSFFQPFQVTTAVELGNQSECSFYSLLGLPISLIYESDYTSLAFGEKSEVNAPLAFAGFGISAPELNYDDYTSLDVAGKVVIVFDHEPGELRPDSPFDGLNPTFHSSLLKKAETARDRGALGLIIIPDRFNHSRSRVAGLGTRGPLESAGIPVLRLSHDWAERLWGASGRKSHDVWRWINQRMTPHSFDFEALFVRVRLDIRPTNHRVNNVVALLPGTSPYFLVLGAHYDHLGTRMGAGPEGHRETEIHNGADDNASGVAALLQLAEDLSATPRHFGILFVAFAGEELGLLGSRHYLEHPAIPLQHTLCMLNFDMIGRSEGELLIGGTGTSPDFGPILEKLALRTPLTLRRAETAGGSSDHLSFSQKGIPVLFFFSGLHSDYHRPTDDFQKINVLRAEQIVDFSRQFVTAVDEFQVLIRRPEAVMSEPVTGPASQAWLSGPLFGGLVDIAFDGSGVRFSEVLNGSPVQRAGLRPGDILVRFEGVPIRSNYEFTRELRQRRPGDQVKIVVIRGQIKRELLVRLARRY